jgi:hypothetical protein
MRYSKATPRLKVKFVDSDTNAVLFEVNDRSWMNVGDMLTDGAITSIMKTEFRGDPPENLMILVVAEFELQE